MALLKSSLCPVAQPVISALWVNGFWGLMQRVNLSKMQGGCGDCDGSRVGALQGMTVHGKEVQLGHAGHWGGKAGQAGGWMMRVGGQLEAFFARIGQGGRGKRTAKVSIL